MELKIPPPIVAAIFALTMWGVATTATFAALTIELSWVVSLVLLVIALTIDLLALMSFQMAKTTINPMQPHKASQLVVVGVYKFTRNPMYLGLGIIMLAIVIWFSNLINIALLFTFVWYITRYQIIPEERVLVELFGDDFKDYQANVRRWL